jgi:hypothetical protein
MSMIEQPTTLRNKKSPMLKGLQMGFTEVDGILGMFRQHAY